MAEPAAFSRIGIVEGFYGRVWSDAVREAFLTALAPWGANTYLYAPKDDPALGERVTDPLDKATAQRLRRLHHAGESRGVALWVGLRLAPPFDAAQPAHLQALVRKALQLVQVGVSGLAVLFDDFAGAQSELQARAVRALAQGLARGTQETALLVCPSRYSLDPLLESTFGPFEADYLARLHRALPPELPWLWTGPQVCSLRISLDDLAVWLREAGIAPGARPVVLWDNYPVNDGAHAGRLHLAPLTGRGPALPQAVQGYLFNPLLQPHLGLLPGATCLAYARDPAGYDPQRAWQAVLAAALPAELHEAVTELAALTRTADGPGGAAVAVPGATGHLHERLMRSWDALTRGGPIEPYVLIDFRRVMNQLQQGLPEALRAEAMPWLGRLWRALRLFEAAAAGAPQEVLGPLRAEFVEWREEAPMPQVLGPWFPLGLEQQARGPIVRRRPL